MAACAGAGKVVVVAPACPWADAATCRPVRAAALDGRRCRRVLGLAARPQAGAACSADSVAM